MTMPSNLASITASHPFLGPLLTQALTCLCNTATAAPSPPAHCSFRIGNEVIHDLGLDGDFCCEGLAYVTLVRVYPSSEDFPQEDIAYQSRSRCGPLSWGVDLKLGLVRCAPVSQGNQVIPDTEWEAATLQGIYDTQTLITAACCVRNWVIGGSAAFDGMSSIMGSVTEGTPNGGCVERYLDLTVQMPGCGC